jgi:hypothetical protein
MCSSTTNTIFCPSPFLLEFSCFKHKTNAILFISIMQYTPVEQSFTGPNNGLIFLLSKIFYKIVYYHIIYMCDFFIVHLNGKHQTVSVGLCSV